ncbi:MAG TPA: DHA2 family efflux MFS transporter permease subunit [Solirubrobacteraceae bacterium]
MSAEGANRSGFDRALILVSGVVVLGAIMSILDTTIVNIAIDRLSVEFHTSLSTIQWVTTGYMLALATVIPLTGWAADRFGTKRLYMTSIGLFLIGSALSGAAWSAGSLIAFRILQGLGGGMILPAGMTILTQAAGPRRIGRVMSVVGVPMLMGPVIGPILGGWLVDDVSWRWIFYVNLPIGALALPFAYRVLPRDRPEPSQRLDVLGLCLLSPGLALLVYGLAETATQGGFGAARVLVPLLTGAALLGGFAWHALRARQPLIDLRLFRNRTVTAGATTSFLFATAFFGAMLLLPLYYQTVRGESALTAGLLLAPQGLGAALMMPIAGKIVDKRGPGKVVLFGLALIVAGMAVLTQVGADTSYVLLGATLFVLGLGMGSTMMPAMTAALQTLSRPAVPRATSALNIIQRVGGSLGTALLAVILQHELTSRIPSASGGGLGAVQSAGRHMSASTGQILADSFGHTFWWAVALCAAAAIPAFFLPRRPPAEEPVAPAEEEAESVAVPV